MYILGKGVCIYAYFLSFLEENKTIIGVLITY